MPDGIGRDPRVDKHDVLIDKLVEQQIRIEEMLKVQIRRADIQEEALNKKNDTYNEDKLKLATTLAGIGTTMNIIKWIGGIVGTFLVVFILQQVFIK